jgi:hypothetical protein
MSEVDKRNQPMLYGSEVPEKNAQGRVASLYGDIREILGLGMVNLIYRRMAASDGVLEWVWDAIRDVAGSCEVERQLIQLYGDVSWPRLVPADPASLPLLGIDEVEMGRLTSVLTEYNRGNRLNLLLLSAFIELQKQGGSASNKRRRAQRSTMAGKSDLVPILDLDEMEAQTKALVGVLAKYVSPPGRPMIPSLFRHLAHWPGFLALIAPHILQAISNGQIEKISSNLKNVAVEGAPGLATGMSVANLGQLPTIETRGYWLGEIGAYLAKPIPEMIVIGYMIESILPLKET